MSRKERMYGKSPTMKRDEESGEMGVHKKEANEPEKGTEGAIRGGDEAMPAPVRHVMERHDMHARHEHEHAHHDHMEHGDKKEMHERHEKEMKDMHKRHEKEMGGGEHKKEMKSDEKGDKILNKATKSGETEKE